MLSWEVSPTSCVSCVIDRDEENGQNFVSASTNAKVIIGIVPSSASFCHTLQGATRGITPCFLWSHFTGLLARHVTEVYRNDIKYMRLLIVKLTCRFQFTVCFIAVVKCIRLHICFDVVTDVKNIWFYAIFYLYRKCYSVSSRLQVNLGLIYAKRC